MANGNGKKKLKTARSKAELWRTFFSAANTIIGLSTLLIVVYVNFLR